MEAQLKNGMRVLLDDKPLGKGGEGTVHRVLSSGTSATPTAAKLYEASKRTSEREQKLAYLAAHPPAEVADAGRHVYLSWPQQLLFQGKQFAGFTMPEAGGGKLAILCQANIDLDLARPWERFDHPRPGARALRLAVCANLCHAVASLQHKQSYVLTDLKPDNVLLTQQGLVCLIDMDSVQVSQGRSVLFASTVQTPEYAPPEASTNPVQKLPSWDNFSLAVILYQILFGIHPFQCQPALSNVSGMAEFIAAGLYPHGRNRRAIESFPPPHNRLGEFPAEVAALFGRCFDEGLHDPARRPGAAEWFDTLKRLQDAPAEIRSFEATPPLVTSATPVRLSWGVVGATKLTLSGVGDVTGQTEALVSVKADTVFTLEATSFSGHVTRKTRTVATDRRPADIGSFAPTAPAISLGDSVTLRWDTDRATRLTLGPDVGDVYGRNSATVQPTRPGRANYVLRAETAFGVVSQAMAEVTVHPLPVLKDFKAERAKVKAGQPVRLTWASQHCARLTLLDGATPHDVTGETHHTLSPTTDTTYTLIAEGLGGLKTIQETASVRAFHDVRIESFAADHLVIIETVPTVLRWRTRHGQQAQLTSSGPDLPAGGIDVKGKQHLEVYPRDSRTTYTLKVSNDLDVSEQHATVAVMPLPRLEALTLPALPMLQVAAPPALPDLLLLAQPTIGLMPAFPAPSPPVAPAVRLLVRLWQVLRSPVGIIHLGPQPVRE